MMSLFDLFYGFDSTRSLLAQSYPQANLESISNDKLIDLYIQTRHDEGAPWDEIKELRNGYGYDTDYFFGFTSRDKRMLHETEHWLEEFFQQFDPCVGPSFVAGYSPPENDKIVDFLNSGKYTP